MADITFDPASMSCSIVKGMAHRIKVHGWWYRNIPIRVNWYQGQIQYIDFDIPMSLEAGDKAAGDKKHITWDRDDIPHSIYVMIEAYCIAHADLFTHENHHH